MHSLVWLIDGLAKGDPFAWLVLAGMAIILGIAIAHDLWANRGKERPR